MMLNFWEPFCSDVVEGWWRYDRETDLKEAELVVDEVGHNDRETAYKENIGLRVRQWSQSIIIFLSSGIP